MDSRSEDATDPVESYEELATFFRRLASPIRLAIIDRLATGESSVHELVDALGHSQPLISQHLRILRDANLVTAGRRGQEMVYRIADDHVTHIVRDGMTHTQEETS